MYYKVVLSNFCQLDTNESCLEEGTPTEDLSGSDWSMDVAVGELAWLIMAVRESSPL